MEEYEDHIREHGKSNRGRKPSVLRLVLGVNGITTESTQVSERVDADVAPQ